MTITPAKATTQAYGVGVLAKAVAVLAVLEDGPATNAELAAATGIPRGTVSRLVNALTDIGLIARSESQLFVGPWTLQLAAATQRVDEKTARNRILGALRADTGAHAARLVQRHGRAGTQRLCLAEALDPDATEATQSGVPVPMHAGPVARVLLAWQRPSDEATAALREITPYTAAVLAHTRHRGLALGLGGPERDIVVLAAPVRDLRRQVVAAVTISGPAQALTSRPDRVHDKTLLDAARQIPPPLQTNADHPALPSTAWKDRASAPTADASILRTVVPGGPA